MTHPIGALSTDLMVAQLETSGLEAKVVAQAAELKQTQAAMTSTHQVTIDGLVFESSLRVSAFVQTHKMSKMPVCCIDVASFLQLAANEVIMHSQAVAEEAAAVKTGYGSHIQLVIATSFQMILPAFFGGAAASTMTKSGTTSTEMKNASPSQPSCLSVSLTITPR